MRIHCAWLWLVMSLGVSAGDCILQSDWVCVEGEETRVISGEALTRSCWRYQRRYRCLDNHLSEERACRDLRAQGCTEQRRYCDGPFAINGTCSVQTLNFSCLIQDAVYEEVQDCSTSVFCEAGICQPTHAEPALPQDLAVAATAVAVIGESAKAVNEEALAQGFDVHCPIQLAEGHPNTIEACHQRYPEDMRQRNQCIAAISGSADEAANCQAQYSALYDENQLRIFKGEDLRCQRGLFSSYDCCSEDGWLYDLHNECRGGDIRRLGHARQQQACHHVGSYCSNRENLTGTCLENTKTYCCFSSALSRIIHQQGRPQFSMDWGGSRTPQCQGFTPEQIQQLDFSQISLSEYFDDAYSDLENLMPEEGALLQSLQQQLQLRVNE